jgi:Set1/Ash2 histone methyltransferase complex subunit ASH2
MKPVYTPTTPLESNLLCFSSTYKAKAIKLYDSDLIANGEKGYRSVLGTQGVTEGTFYYEVTILNSSSESLNIPVNTLPASCPMFEPLIASHNSFCLEKHDSVSIGITSAHMRIGFATSNLDLETPVGTDLNSYSYRDLDGSVFHDGYRKAYSCSYGINDIIGCLIKLQPQKPKIKGKEDSKFIESEGSEIHYFKNGEYLGKAFENIYEGCYFPAVALYQYARVEINITKKLAFPRVLTDFQAKPFSV